MRNTILVSTPKNNGKKEVKNDLYFVFYLFYYIFYALK